MAVAPERSFSFSQKASTEYFHPLAVWKQQIQRIVLLHIPALTSRNFRDLNIEPSAASVLALSNSPFRAPVTDQSSTMPFTYLSSTPGLKHNYCLYSVSAAWVVACVPLSSSSRLSRLLNADRCDVVCRRYGGRSERAVLSCPGLMTIPCVLVAAGFRQLKRRSETQGVVGESQREGR